MPVGEMRDVLRVVAESHREDRLAAKEIDVDAARVARLLKHSARTRIGLLPVNRRANLPSFALELAAALGAITQRMILVVDPEQASGFIAPRETEALYFACSPIPYAAVLCPTTRAPMGARFEMVRVMLQLIDQDSDTFGHALVDLSGCVWPGELLGAMRYVDGIVLVGSAGTTKESQILDLHRQIPSDLNLGLVLTEDAR